jgi:hypothetical protein
VATSAAPDPGLDPDAVLADADPQEDCVTVKVSLTKLTCSSGIRAGIENVVMKLQVLAARGSLIAVEAVTQALLGGGAPPDVGAQSFWYKALVEAARGPVRCKMPELRDAADKLFGSAEPVDAFRMWPFMASLSLDMKTAAANACKATFHVQLSKALRRTVLLWELTNPGALLPGGNDKDRGKLRGEVLRHAERRSTGHRTQLPWPAAGPVELRASLETLMDACAPSARASFARWRADFSDALPCPTPEFIKPKHSPTLLRWAFALQQQRVCAPKAAHASFARWR